MTDRGLRDGEGDDGGDGVRIGRRGFISVGLAGAGALAAPVSIAGARSSSTAPRLTTARAGVSADAADQAGPIAQIPLRASFPDLPAIPLDPAGALDTLAKLSVRAQQITQAKQSLTRRFTIRGVTRTGYWFLFGPAAPTADARARQTLTTLLQGDHGGALPDLVERRLRRQHRARPAAGGTSTKPLSLERPEQYSISWTTVPDVYETGRPALSSWAASLTDADSATAQFWPTISRHGVGFNLILPERVTRATAKTLRRTFQAVWGRELQAALAAGDLYVIDMSRFETLRPNSVDGATRFTPSTVTLLTHDSRTKTLTPVAIAVSGFEGRARKLFSRADATDGAWLYALQAAKASIAVFGIWLGHVYQWHLVTAAMQMAMFNTLSTDHPVYLLLAPQSKYLIGFDDVLLQLWSAVAPPTSLATSMEFLGLANDYAAGRSFFDDDPRATLASLGLRQGSFSRDAPWDQYPVVQQLLTVWDLVAAYVGSYVRATYRSDASVAADRQLETWIATASASDGGNIRGLPNVTTRSALQRVLTSLVYRITVHGIARLTSTSNPALTFVANFPHCLQRADIPSPHAPLDTQTLLTYLPNLGAISQAVTFYFTFAFSTPYEPMIPFGGVSSDLQFSGGPRDSRNRALIKLREGLVSFMNGYQPDAPQRFQWPRNIET
ncbi:MAG: lipoxygenase family protein [Solirubrobacteraceae bacterium]